MRCSLYIHIPFCKSKCRYCDFYSLAWHYGLVDEYIDALAREWELHCRRGAWEIDTVFVGGGTPSVLTVRQWERLHDRIFARLPLRAGAEWTVECNPESFTEEKAALLAAMGVTRITFGIQTLVDRELKTIGRPHSARLALELFGLPSLDRFESVGVDLMYGLPGQTAASFSGTVAAVLEYPAVRHISAYELTVAASTPFGRHRSLLPLPGEDAMEVMTDMLCTMLAARGFEHYEVSNFARDGHRCRHNCACWDHQPYIGLGCAAHSYLHPRRFRNVADVGRYCAVINGGDFAVDDEETIDAVTFAREMAFLRLRTADGLDEAVFRDKTGMDFDTWAGAERLTRFADDGLLIHQPPWWRPTSRGMWCADYIARELF